MQALYKTFYWSSLGVVALLGGLLSISLLPVGGNIAVKIVKSGSMEPVIKTGSIVIDKPESSYHVGDIVTFGLDTKTQIPTTHRIVAITGDGTQQMITTKGDANDAQDPAQTPMSLVHGKVIFTVPYIGYALAYAREPMGFAILVGIPALLIILEELLKIVREVTRLRRAKRKAHYSYAQPHLQPNPTRPVRRIVD